MNSDQNQRVLHKIRGAALVESAVVLVYLLGLLLAGFELGLIAYYQLAMDQGAQFQARATSYNQNTYSTDAANSLLKNNINAFQSIAFTAPTTNNALMINNTDSISSSYNFADPQARTGGFTFVAPLQQTATFSHSSGVLHIGSTPITIQATAVEAAYQELCAHFCLINGGLANALNEGNALNYFTQGDNTVPYFIGYHFMKTCLSNPSYDLTQIAPVLSSPHWDSCPSGGLVWRAIGTAEHLDSTNNFYTGPGETLAASYTGYPKLPPPADGTGPFFEMWCHRNFYVSIDLNAFVGHEQAPPAIDDTQAISNFMSPWLGNDANGNPLAGKLIYNAATPGGTNGDPNDLTANAGWDSSVIGGSANGLLTYATALSPWWGCGAFNGGP